MQRHDHFSEDVRLLCCPCIRAIPLAPAVAIGLESSRTHSVHHELRNHITPVGGPCGDFTVTGMATLQLWSVSPPPQAPRLHGLPAFGACSSRPGWWIDRDAASKNIHMHDNNEQLLRVLPCSQTHAVHISSLPSSAQWPRQCVLIWNALPRLAPRALVLCDRQLDLRSAPQLSTARTAITLLL